MPLSVEMLHSQPQTEVYSLIRDLIDDADVVSIAVGFMTEAGISLVSEALRSSPNKLRLLVVGATTLKACEGLDHLLTIGVPPASLKVYLGHSRGDGTRFTKYHPMMHSKIYLFESGKETAAIIGSHNMTGFALGGQNSEASVLIRGESSDQIFTDIRTHLASVENGSQIYDKTKCHGYAYWFQQMYVGYVSKVLYGDGEDGVEGKKNIVAIAVAKDGKMPSIGDVIYLQVPRQDRIMRTLGDKVHFYVVNQLPASVQHGLDSLIDCKVAFTGYVKGSNEDGVEKGDADWEISDLNKPVLVATGGTVNPIPNATENQVFIRIEKVLHERYKYIFDPLGKWKPVYDKTRDNELLVEPNVRKHLASLNLIPPEHLPWKRVMDLEPSGAESKDVPSIAYREFTPDSGRFFVVSRRRKRIDLKPRIATNDSQHEVIGSGAVNLAREIPGEVLLGISKWAKENERLKPFQRGIAYTVGKLLAAGGTPSEKQAKQVVRLLRDSIDGGFSSEELDGEVLRRIENLDS